jgi:ABC-type multidrug transport system fused ATPase/permease subunit
MTSAERVIEYIDLKPEDAENVDQFVTLPPQWPMGGITFENFSFRYSSTAPWVLKNLNIAIQPNEKVSLSIFISNHMNITFLY